MPSDALHYFSLVILGLMFIAIDHLFHRRRLSKCNDLTIKNLRTISKHPSPNFIGASLYVAHWMFIIAAIRIYAEYENTFIYAIIAFFVAIQLRSLQELAHFSAHNILCNSSQLGNLLANIFFQNPALLLEISQRRSNHLKHHSNANTNKDPNTQLLKEIGFVGPMSKWKFFYYCIYPTTPQGLTREIKNTFHAIKTRSRPQIIQLAAVNASYLILFYKLGFLCEFLTVYSTARFFIYPWLSWISLLVEHRWHVSSNSNNLSYIERQAGRPTNYQGLLGHIIRLTYFPYGDCFHLAHSLFPKARFNYLPTLDKACHLEMLEYKEHSSYGLVIPSKNGKPSALSDLFYRMTRLHESASVDELGAHGTASNHPDAFPRTIIRLSR